MRSHRFRAVAMSAGRYQRAAVRAGSGVEAFPAAFWGKRIVIASAFHAGNRAESRRRAKGLLRKDPNLTVALARPAWPFRPAFMEQLADGLAAAGIPRLMRRPFSMVSPQSRVRRGLQARSRCRSDVRRRRRRNWCPHRA